MSESNGHTIPTVVHADVLKANKKLVPVLSDTAFIASNNQIEENQHDEFREKFKKSILDQSKDYPLPEAVVSIVQNLEVFVFLTLKSFSLWQGKQKSKKTTALALVVAAFIRGQTPQGGVHFSSTMEGVVLWFDNEQGESYAARTMRLILKLAGLETSLKLVYCDLRGYSPSERKKIVEAGIQSTPGVRLVVIDGLVDLLNDFMDAGEGHLTTTDILKLCSLYNIHIAGVLHQNKNDKNARAHIGTISSQKCEIEISTEIDPDDKAQSLITCVNSRGIPFEPLAIRWDKGSLPCIVQDWNAVKASDVKASKNFERAKEIVETVFKPLSSWSRSEAEKAIMKAALVSESTANRRMNDYLGWGLITKGDDGNYRIKIKEGSRVHEGSNEGS